MRAKACSPLRVGWVLVLWDITQDKERILNEFQILGTAVTNDCAGPLQSIWTSSDLALDYAVKQDWMNVPEFRQALIPLLRELTRSKAAAILPNIPNEYWAATWLRRLEEMESGSAAHTSAREN